MATTSLEKTNHDRALNAAEAVAVGAASTGKYTPEAIVEVIQKVYAAVRELDPK